MRDASDAEARRGTALQRRAPAVALLLRLEHQATQDPEHGAMRRRSHAIALRDGGRPRDDFPVHTGDDGLLPVEREPRMRRQRKMCNQAAEMIAASMPSVAPLRPGACRGTAFGKPARRAAVHDRR